MAKKTGGDVITHCNSVRTRVNGSGNLISALYDTGTINQLLTNAVMSDPTSRALTQLANFKGERIAWEIRINQINEWFFVSNMYAYVKPTAASYPQP